MSDRKETVARLPTDQEWRLYDAYISALWDVNNSVRSEREAIALGVVRRAVIESLAAEADSARFVGHDGDEVQLMFDHVNRAWFTVADWLRGHLGDTEATG